MRSFQACCSVRIVQTILAYKWDYDIVYNPFTQTDSQAQALDIGDMNYISSLAAISILFLDELQSPLYGSYFSS